SDSWQVISPPVTIIDDGATGFSTVGTWSVTNNQGYQSDFRSVGAGKGAKTASWTFSGLTPGLYRVSATWVAAGDRATNAPFTILDGSTVLATVTRNQRLV